MKQLFVTQIQRATLILILSLSFAACAKRSLVEPSKVSGPVAQNNGGGIDSSGGDAGKSTADQVRQAGKNIEGKLALAFHRIYLQFATSRTGDFDENFGVGSKQLLQPLLKNKSKGESEVVGFLKRNETQFEFQDAACEGDGQKKDGSASTSNGKNLVCISVSRLQRLAPASLELEILALAAHEVSHLFGFDEEHAQGVQDFFLRNPTVVWPKTEDVRDLFEIAKRLENLALLTVQGISENASDATLCQYVGEMPSQSGTMVSLTLPRSGRVYLGTSLHGVILVDAIEGAVGFCDQAGGRARVDDFQVSRGDRTKLLENALEINHAAQSLKQRVGAIREIDFKGHFVPTFEALTWMAAMETPQFAQMKKVEASKVTDLDLKDIGCKIRLVTDRSSAPQGISYGFRPRLVHQSEAGMLYGHTDIIQMMFRKMKGAKGVGIAVLDKNVEKVEGGENAILTDAGDSVVSPASYLVRGVSPEFQATVLLKTGSLVTVRCEILSRKEDPEKKIEIKDESVDTTPEREDDTFVVNISGTTLAAYGGRGGKRGELVGTAEVTKLKYNGMIVLDTATPGLQCIISESLAEKKKMDLKKLANEMKSGARFNIVCDSNGGRRSDGTISLAPWAFDVSVEPKR